jgi:hypothetical protein
MFKKVKGRQVEETKLPKQDRSYRFILKRREFFKGDIVGVELKL